MKISQKQDNSGYFLDLILNFTPILLIIALFEIISIEVYLNIECKVKLFLWRLSQAVGGVILGYLSDTLNRKKIFILTQICGIVIIPFWIFNKSSEILLILLGLFFNPTPISRAAIIDNFSKESKAKLIAITYISQFLPWCFYIYISNFLSLKVLIISTIAILLNIVITYIFFKDRRDITVGSHHQHVADDLLHKKSGKKALYTLGALLPGQLVFFLSDTFFEDLAYNAGIYAALGVGSMIGVIIGMFYRKIPHLSLLTFCFGFGLLLSSVPLITNFLAPKLKVDLPYQLMIFSCLGGFYLPFVFDVVLSATSSNYRGTACGVIDLIISLSSIIGVGIIVFFNPHELTILFITSILFLFAAIIQKKGEKHA